MNELSENIDMDRSFFVGDKESYIVAEKLFGVKTILLKPDNGPAETKDADFVVGNLADIATIIQD